MSQTTVFPVLSLDRAQVHWEDYLRVPTPVEWRETAYYKREDYFAPLGYGGINGSKLRQLIWLLDVYGRQAGKSGVISAGSVKSPQHAMTAVVAAHYNMTSMHVLGATKPDTCLKHDSVAIAVAAGALFDFIPVAYNPSLQKRVRDLMKQPDFRDFYPLEYAISLDHRKFGREQLEQFHSGGAFQTWNLPMDMSSLIVPAGSLNTTTSIILGLSQQAGRDPVPVHLVGVGHNRLLWLMERLAALGIDFQQVSRRSAQWQFRKWDSDGPWWPVQYHDLVGRGYTSYQDMWEETRDGVVGHVTYEAKMFRWLKTPEGREILKGNAMPLIWIVGSEPKLENMKAYL